MAETARTSSCGVLGYDELSAPFQKKPGEGFWVVGLGLTPLGGSLGWSYEAEHWRLGAIVQGAENDVGYLGIDGAWIPGDRDIAPYVGLGLGVVGIDDESVLGTKADTADRLRPKRTPDERRASARESMLTFKRCCGSRAKP